jgi:membrane protease subunit HflK
MPWSNQTGGGPKKGGSNGSNNGSNNGPWGQPPKGPNKPRGPQDPGIPPDLEEILKKSQDTFKQAIPGGGGGGAIFGLAFIGLFIFWLFQSFYTVQPDQLGVELRFGKPKAEISQPGLHFHFWPVETVEIAQVSEQQINIGSSGRGGGNSGIMLSGDQNIVDVSFSTLWSVNNPSDFLFNVKEPSAMVRQLSESAMREVVGRRKAQDIFRDDRAGIAQEVKDIVQNTLNIYNSGMQVNQIAIENAAPPAEVADAFDDVQRAEQQEDQFIEQANGESNKILGAARGEAARITEQAAAYKNQIVEEAKGEAERFLLVLEEYKKAPEVTRQRLYLETMEEVMGRSDKIFLEGGSGVVPYLPLNELNKKTSGGQN